MYNNHYNRNSLGLSKLKIDFDTRQWPLELDHNGHYNHDDIVALGFPDVLLFQF